MNRRDRRDIAHEARAFMIWREGHQVDWDCTATELAVATGISLRTVLNICTEHGWPIERGKGGREVKELGHLFALNESTGGRYLATC